MSGYEVTNDNTTVEHVDAILPLNVVEVMYLDDALLSKIQEGEALIKEGFDVRKDVDNFIELRQKIRHLAGLDGDQNETTS